ncbi:MAG TPA: HAD family phosphatase [Solirubrobacteraceae bacterium]|nr:HAD family phosphatase [Solirubrobacteraceae bacterium]
MSASSGQPPAAAPIEAVICDFGGVLTSPLADSFRALTDGAGIPLEALGQAMTKLAESAGSNPLYELEKGQLTEVDFLEQVSAAVSAQAGRAVTLHDFGAAYFSYLQPNEPMISFMRELAAREYRMALLTNNVREWEPRWRAMLPVDEIFSLIVDSAFVGMRKPEREIYDLTLSGLELPADRCIFIDDFEINCEAAREVGMTAVRFESAEQAIGEVEAALAERPNAPPRG